MDHVNYVTIDHVSEMESVKVGVAGHRRLLNPQAVEKAARDVGLRLMANAGPIEIVSPLAEGADRLLAQGLQKTLPRATLTALLPLPPSEYENDFDDEESLKAFRTLLRSAARVRVAGTGQQRPLAYADLISELVETCQVFVVVWDGEPSRGAGGTADLVTAIRSRQKPLALIREEPSGTCAVCYEPPEFWR